VSDRTDPAAAKAYEAVRDARDRASRARAAAVGFVPGRRKAPTPVIGAPAAPTTWSCFVPGEPKSMQTGSIRRLPNGRAFPARRHTDWGNRVALAAAQARPAALLEGPLAVTVTVFRSRPKAAKRAVWPVTRPDLDNVLKALDVLQGLVMRNDAQIVRVVAEKRYAADSPGLAITVTALEPSA